MLVSYELERRNGMSIIEENAKTIKDWLKHLDFEHEHPGYGKDVYKKLDEIITEAQKIKED
jgi:hypothetical protein